MQATPATDATTTTTTTTTQSDTSAAADVMLPLLARGTRLTNTLRGGMRLIESRLAGLNVKYVPLEAGVEWTSIVDPRDHDIISQIIALTVKQVQLITLDGLPKPPAKQQRDDDDDDDDDDERSDGMDLDGDRHSDAATVSLTRTSYQVKRHVDGQRYVLWFDFPAGAEFTLRDANTVFSLFPTRIIQDESGPLVTSRGHLGFKWVVAMHPWVVHTNAEVILLRSAPTLQPVTHVVAETIGRNHEGRAVKRQRESSVTSTRGARSG